MLSTWWMVDRWRSSTAYTGLSLAEQGAYRNLLDEMAIGDGFLPVDETRLAEACGHPPSWPFVRIAVLARFTRIGDRYTDMASPWGQPPMSDGRRPPIPKAVRAAVVARDSARCRDCGSDTGLQVDHVYPYSMGGAGFVGNLQLLCGPCNMSKGATVR